MTAGLEYIPILTCGSCGEIGALDPTRFADGRVALQAFRDKGWQSEPADDEHSERWWQCSDCLKDEVRI